MIDPRLDPNFTMESALDFAEESGFTWLARVLKTKKEEG